MEMNTRLQVEHPVTEMITGLDLVEWQLRVAAGEDLPATQAELALRGHALEVRLYAEDPARGFVPAIGRIGHLALPEESRHVRVDAGVEAGDEIGPHYDPMIGKLIVWDDSREAALRRMRRALGRTRIVGVANNVSFLSRLVTHERFERGRLDTGLVEDEAEALWPVDEEPSAASRLCAALAVVLRARRGQPTSTIDPWSPWSTEGSWRLNGPAARTVELACAGARSTVRVETRGDGFRMELGGVDFDVAAAVYEGERLEILLEGRRVEAWVVPWQERLHVFVDEERWIFDLVDPLAHAGEGSDVADSLHSPMPGTVTAVLVEAGAEVERGTTLLVLEAMKMEHAVKAPSRGVVRRLLWSVGDQVPEGAELVEFEASE
jgi:3-methylcrotonyl-CoA carboxylase alpha subunit